MTSLYVNGDSWSFKAREYDYPIWPELVSEKIGARLINDSLGCGSNSRVVDSLKNHYLLGLSPTLIIVGLSGHHRYHLPAADFGSWVIGPLVALHEHTGQSNSTVRDCFFTHSYSELDSVYRYYRDIWSMYELAHKFGCKLLCFQTWDSQLAELGLLNSQENVYNYVKTFYDKESYYMQQYIKAFDRLREISKQWYYQEMPMAKILTSEDFDNTMHPNHSGHEKIAQQTMDLIREYNLL